MLSLTDKNGKGPIVLLGNFDGAHLGHASLIKKAKEIKRTSGGRIIAWTFDSIFGKEALTSPTLRALWLIELGVEQIVFEEFERVRELGGKEFVKAVLKDTLGASACICGYNYRFGKGGAHTPDELVSLCNEAGITCFVVDEERAELDGKEVSLSSTLLRSLIREGRVDAAARLSGHCFAMLGEVKKGRGVGRRIGFPTINQSAKDSGIILPRGVYATFCRIDGEYYPSVTNIGLCPTFKDVSELTIETHIIGYEGDLYGKTVPIGYLARLRDEKEFPSEKELGKEIEKNVSQALLLFEGARGKLRLPDARIGTELICRPKSDR